MVSPGSTKFPEEELPLANIVPIPTFLGKKGVPVCVTICLDRDITPTAINGVRMAVASWALLGSLSTYPSLSRVHCRRLQGIPTLNIRSLVLVME